MSVDVSPTAGLCDLTPGYQGADHPYEQSLAHTTQRKVNGESTKENMAHHSMTLSSSKSLSVY